MGQGEGQGRGNGVGVSLAEAASMVGVTVEALRQRLNRGTLREVAVDGQRGGKVRGVHLDDLREAFPEAMEQGEPQGVGEDLGGRVVFLEAELSRARDQVEAKAREVASLARALGAAEGQVALLESGRGEQVEERKRLRRQSVALGSVGVLAVAALGWVWSSSQREVQASSAQVVTARESAVEARESAVDERERRTELEAELAAERLTRAQVEARSAPLEEFRREFVAGYVARQLVARLAQRTLH